MVFFFSQKKEVTVTDEEKAPMVQVEETIYGSSSKHSRDDSSLENMSVSIAPSLPSYGSGEDRRLLKTKGSFWEDARNFQEGKSVPRRRGCGWRTIMCYACTHGCFLSSCTYLLSLAGTAMSLE